MTIDKLIDAVDKDEKSHRTRELAELFISAMNDWPTFNQTDIDAFVKELKDYFGTPLTIEKIDSKRLRFGIEGSAWRHEAGTSIAELIDRSIRFDGESDFDKILERILNYYKK